MAIASTSFASLATADPRCQNNDPFYGYCVGGKILEEFNQAGGIGFFGNATNTELPALNNGRWQPFAKGSSIYWHSSVSGGHANQIGGLIRDKWGQLGYEGGSLGYPTTRERLPGFPAVSITFRVDLSIGQVRLAPTPFGVRFAPRGNSPTGKLALSDFPSQMSTTTTEARGRISRAVTSTGTLWMSRTGPPTTPAASRRPSPLNQTILTLARHHRNRPPNRHQAMPTALPHRNQTRPHRQPARLSQALRNYRRLYPHHPRPPHCHPPYRNPRPRCFHQLKRASPAYNVTSEQSRAS